MKKKSLLTLFAAVVAGSVLFCSGCGVDLTSVNEGETTLSAEMEAENLSDGTVSLHFVFYDADGARVTNAAVTFTVDDFVVYTGTTDEYGRLDSCILPGNKSITCEITDGIDEVLASSVIVFKISTEYSDLTIYTTDAEDDSERVLEIPADQSDLRAAVYLTETGRLTFVNLTPYDESYDAVSEEEEEYNEDLEGGVEDADESEADSVTVAVESTGEESE